MKNVLTKVAKITLLFTLIFNVSACNISKKQADGSVTTENIIQKKHKSGDILFSTEYDIEDYCQGCFIVSKNDGLLYGVLDMKGNEVLPVKYDELYFMNADEVKHAKQKNVYIGAVYEDEHSIFDNSGTLISNNNLDIFHDENLDYYDTDAPFFCSHEKINNSDELKVYTENMEEILYLKLDETGGFTYMKWLNNNLCLISSVIQLVPIVRLYNKNGVMLKEWQGTVWDTEILSSGIALTIDVRKELSKPEYIISTIDENGNIINETIEAGANKVKSISAKQSNETYWLGYSMLYKSNGTWKLTDFNEEPVYDERYYDCYRYYEDSNECFLLFNEDNDICVIDAFGNLIADYGVIDPNDDYNGDNLTILNGLRTNNKILVGEEFLCFVVKDGSNNDVYYFEGTKNKSKS